MARTSGVAGTCSFRYCSIGAGLSRWTTPRTLHWSMPGCALGQSFDMRRLELLLELHRKGDRWNPTDDVPTDGQNGALRRGSMCRCRECFRS